MALQSKVRPWATDFAAPTRFSRPTEDWLQRVKQNVAYYKSNYGVLFIGFLIFSIVSNPVLLIVLSLLAGAWTYLLAMRPRQDDGSLYPVTVAGRTLSGFEQKASLTGLTFIMLMITSLGSTIFWALGVSFVAVGLHAALHTTEFHEVDTEDFGGSSQAQYPTGV